ncbi:peptide-N(4)-(N-acetyl-beta-glucosaminyl)asparagine amidase [Andrographis paniculata]|uniref:peptide-N(4)-(N-acetyl-beta- glucosaminyl)asparagine amidase n=1 Tax=Andrographis paniculata TaxID=175694 RepID=UPI0021E90907|nr:peptide-N(4)-(N-acetyl-beta-glucosaminyl)asparagine amidase [Andrographis paniculata]
MVARKFLVHHGGSAFDLDYDTDDGFEVLKFQLFSLTSVPPEQQKILGGDDDRIVSSDLDLESISEKLRLVSIDEDGNEGEEEKPAVDFFSSDEELARMLQAEEEALMMQQFVSNENREQAEQRIRPYVDQVLLYEDPRRQDAACKTVPVDKLQEKAMVALAREGTFKPSKDEVDHAFLLQLLFWFKQSFRWVDAPPCDSCTNDTSMQGMGVPNSSESLYGASRIELFGCKSCSNVTRFPRYTDPLKLLETRKGRCGEWANCFTLYCRAFGYETRLMLDFTDHVWTECFSPFLGRWMHLDPCESIYDTPLLYEKGWNKKLNYVIAIAYNGVSDATKRYTRKWHEVLSRRALTTEPVLARILSDITRDLRKNFTSDVLVKLEERDKSEVEELERNLYSKDDNSVSLPGRQSGDKEWRISRSEFGSDEHCSVSASSCPVRKCVDEHVTKLYDAFSPIISQLVNQASEKSKATEVLGIFRRILVTLKSMPFKTRRTIVTDVSTNPVFSEMLPSFGKLLDALSLKYESHADGTQSICIASDPVLTSLSLPVAFHALDDLIHNVNICGKLTKGSLSWPLLKLNRICSGFVLASGEELPFGIATSAFDGTRMSKWEEPNGATGCWIIYKVFDNRMHELAAYELMSANDAPERDPMDWILEGSEDGGSSWRILDNQASQKFHQRFQRKTFEIKSQSFLANAFRFRFLAVQDSKSTTRFQIGSIDLYAKAATVPVTKYGAGEQSEGALHTQRRLQQADRAREDSPSLRPRSSRSSPLSSSRLLLQVQSLRRRRFALHGQPPRVAVEAARPVPRRDGAAFPRLRRRVVYQV